LGEEEIRHVVNHTPIFHWDVVDTAGIQEAYEIEIGTDNEWSVAEQWATGVVASEEKSAEYAGEALVDGAGYFLRIRVRAGDRWGNWFSMTFRMNALPSSPVALFPVAGTQVPVVAVRLSVLNSSDTEGDQLTYDFEIYSDPEMTILAHEITGVAEQPDTTITDYFAATWPDCGGGLLRPGPFEGDPEGCLYWWRARAYDGYEYSDWMEPEQFETRGPRIVLVPGEEPTIQAGIDVAEIGDTVRVAPGVYHETLRLARHSIGLVSSLGPESTLIVSTGSRQPMITFPDYADIESTIRGFTFADGVESAVHTFHGNSSTIENCVFENCLANNGAGIICFGGNLFVRGCCFRGNMGTVRGGAMYVHGADTLIIDSCTFAANRASETGGAIHAEECRYVQIVRSRAIQNTLAEDDGGFYYAKHCAEQKILQNTIVRNTAAVGRGTGISIIYGDTVDVRNNIVAFNRGGYGAYIWQVEEAKVEYNNLFRNGSGNLYGTNFGIGTISADPLFWDVYWGNIFLRPESPCIDAGDPDPQYNDPDGSRNDMGAIPFGTDEEDFDNDGVANDIDNCPTIPNTDQADANNDHVGDACCCGLFSEGYRGNVNCDPDGLITLADVVTLIEHLYITGAALCCQENGNTNGSEDGLVTLNDITTLVDHLYVSHGLPAPCQGAEFSHGPRVFSFPHVEPKEGP
jgi:predicted outer membrane repeat protein